MMNNDQAQEISINALSYLSGNEDLFNQFTALSGAMPDQIRNLAKDPSFLVGVLDFFMHSEPALMTLSEAIKTKPEDIVDAFVALGGRFPE